MCFFMVGSISKTINCYFQKRIAFCRRIYMRKVMKHVAFIFEHPSYILDLFVFDLL